jgi:hypothetical protein
MRGKRQMDGADFYSCEEGLKAARTLVSLLGSWVTDGRVRLQDIAIEFDQAVVNVTPAQYVGLAKRALDESIAEAKRQRGVEP